MIVKMILLWISTFNYFQLQFKKLLLLKSSQLSTQSPGLPNSWLTDARRHRWSRSWNLRSSVMTVHSKKKKKWGHLIMSDQKRPMQSFPNSRGHSGSKHQLAAKTLTDRRHDELPSYSLYIQLVSQTMMRSCLFHWPPLCSEPKTQISFCQLGGCFTIKKSSTFRLRHPLSRPNGQ